MSFKTDKHTVHDFDKRFWLEDTGIITVSNKFRWKMLELADTEINKN